ncbi:MAG TPA: helix-turn-helix transcriptional regulator [Ktedonobacteraceae bacterium]|nr:helix-turn-helix transcriptional regulator [Ktedonobacteraceae bacterium]
MGHDEQFSIEVRFGRAIRKRRNELGLSQEELADLAGLHRTYIGDVERGKRNVSLVNIDKLAKTLGISIWTLFRDYGIEESSEKTP